MANGKTTLSVRADEETAEQFDRIAEESKLTKTDLFPLLLNLWETKKLQNALPGRTDEIESFSASLKHIDSIYRSSLSMAVNAKKEAQEESKKELDSLKIAIQDLQEKNVALEQKLDGLTKVNADLTTEIERLQGQLSDKNAVIKSLESQQQESETAKSVVAQLQTLLLDFKKAQNTQKPQKTKQRKTAVIES